MPQRHLTERATVFVLWLVVAGFLASRHVMWRDEVRAWSLALSGETVGDMLRTVHGEGHPALWYLMLRAGDAVLPHAQAMPIIAFVVGAAAAAIFAFCAPFRWPILALVLFGRFALYEYTVMARNYGIAMLALFAIAALYGRYRDRGWVVGSLLLLLCNTNAPSVVLAAALLLFWAVDLLADQPIGWNRAWRAWLLAAGMAAVGVLLCALAIYPPFNDAAANAPPASVGAAAREAFEMLPLAGTHFKEWIPIGPFALRRHLHVALIPLLLLAILWRWRRSPAALLAGAVAMVGLLAMFAFVYDGWYRHQALLFPFLATLAWLVKQGHGGRWPERWNWRLGARTSRIAARVSNGAILLALGLQVMQSVQLVGRAARGMPESRSYELAHLLARPDLRAAIVIGDPDYNLEALPYYAPNPTYLVREHRFGRYTIFSRHAERAVRLGEVLEAARRLHAATGRPIVIVMSDPLFRSGTPAWHPRGFYGDMLQSAGELRRFLAETRGLASFPLLDEGDESYDVFLYDGSR